MGGDAVKASPVKAEPATTVVTSAPEAASPVSTAVGHGSVHEAAMVADQVLRSLSAGSDAPAPRPDAPPVTTRIRRSVGRAPNGPVTIRREIGKVPEPYKPLQKTQKPAPETAAPTTAATVAEPPVAEAPVAAPTTLVALAASAEANIGRWVGNHDLLLDILLGPFEANWFKAKACLTMEQWPATCVVTPSHDVGIKLMQALVVMRKAKWTAFVTNIVKPQFEERMRMFGAVSGPMTDVAKPSTPSAPPASHGLESGALSGDQDLQSDIDLQDLKKQDKTKGKNFQDIFDSVGAEAVTSDVDLASGGSNSELGVQFVNSRFRTHFAPGKVIPYDPGTVFDINVYASDWIHGEASFSDSDTGVRTITPGAEVKEMTPEDQAKRTRKMEIWSLVKVRRNMEPEEWDEYVEMTLDGIEDDTERAEMEAKLVAADQEYQAFKTNVETRQAEMLAKLTAQERAFFGEGGGSAFGEEGEHYQEDASFTRAANSIYEETLQEVKELRVRIEKLRVDPVRNAAAISALGVLLGDKIAEALTYANEVYATEGAVQHTVLKQGAGKKLEKLKEKAENAHLTKVDYNLTPELYLQAVNENVGDSLHSLHHFASVPKYAVYRAGKYLSRLVDATDLLLGAKKTKVPGYAELFKIGAESVRVKKITNDDGTIEGDPKFVDDDPFFAEYDKDDLPAVRAQISIYGAAIPKLFAEKKQQDAAAQRAAEEQERLRSAATSG